MKIEDLRGRSIVVLGLGQEGLASAAFLRERFPGQSVALADRTPVAELSPAARRLVAETDPAKVHCGPDYLADLGAYEVILKSPGIPLSLPPLRTAVAAGTRITSQTQIFFANCPGVICGVTGTKGKSTTSSLIYAMLREGGLDATLVGNIGIPPLDHLAGARPASIFVYELSSHQLDGMSRSPHVAVVLNIVPEHLDYYASFDEYVAAKENITRFQDGGDWLVYNAAFPLPRRFAASSAARKLPFSAEAEFSPGCFLAEARVVFAPPAGGREEIIPAAEVPLPGQFNLQNVLAAIAAARLLGAPADAIRRAVRNFRSLPHRLELVGTFRGITFYDDALATIPEAAMGALDALGPDVETILLGGFDRHLDFSALGRRLRASDVRTVILFPTTGERIWEAVRAAGAPPEDRLRPFFVADMAEAVALAYRHTHRGKICLHSPASPSFGLFANYRERGEQFKRCVREGAGPVDPSKP